MADEITPVAANLAPTLPVPSREQIMRLHAAMIPIQSPQPAPEHHFAPGMYGRTLLVPAGMCIVGKTHRHAHLLMVLKGHATVASEFGTEELRAPYIGVSQPGVKRVVLAHEDTLFVTVHHNPSDTQDLEAIEEQHILPDVHELPADVAELLA